MSEWNLLAAMMLVTGCYAAATVACERPEWALHERGKGWILSPPLSVEEVERTHLLEVLDTRTGKQIMVPFGIGYESWAALKSKMRSGDQLVLGRDESGWEDISS